MTSSTITAVRPRAQKLSPGARRAMFAATLGTAIEWYDYALYGIAAGLVISPLFFPEAVGDTGPMIAFATFAVGFVVRPVGGLAIAHLGDKIGRKPALLLTILLMGIATTGIGLLPTAETIGIAAPILLVALRALQGLGAGAELSGALTVAAEYTPESRRGFFTGIINAVGGAGSALAMLAFLAVSSVPEEVLLGGLWRVPFLLSAVLFLLALYIRKRLDETPEYLAAKEKNEAAIKNSVPLKEVFKASPRRVIFAILMWSGHNANTYIVLTFALSYLTNTVGFARADALWIALIASSVGCLLSPVWGMVGDRYGHKQVFAGVMIFGALFSIPLFMMMNTGDFALALIGLLIASGITFGGTSGTAGAVSANLFPARFRFSGIAAAKEINAALIAGPTPFIAAALVSVLNGEPWLAAGFISLCCLVTVFSLAALGRGTGNTAVIDDATDIEGAR